MGAPRSRVAISSRASCAIERGFVVGAHRARITFQPFRAFAASATMLATSAGSTRSSEMGRFEPYSAASSRPLSGALRADDDAGVGLARVRERLALPELDVEQPFLSARLAQPDRPSLAVVEDVRGLVDDEIRERASAAT
jgi:hypothetical protein